jgi:hypothetical protein
MFVYRLPSSSLSRAAPKLFCFFRMAAFRWHYGQSKSPEFDFAIRLDIGCHPDRHQCCSLQGKHSHKHTHSHKTTWVLPNGSWEQSLPMEEIPSGAPCASKHPVLAQMETSSIWKAAACYSSCAFNPTPNKHLATKRDMGEATLLKPVSSLTS